CFGMLYQQAANMLALHMFCHGHLAQFYGVIIFGLQHYAAYYFTILYGCQYMVGTISAKVLVLQRQAQRLAQYVLPQFIYPCIFSVGNEDLFYGYAIHTLFLFQF